MLPSQQEVQYCGLFDDKVNDYPWGDTKMSLGYINEQLAMQALFNPAIALGDGYLMHYDAGRTALVNRERSPLRDLIEAGFVVILSRNDGKLHEMPKMVAKRVPSYKRLLRSNAWSDLEPELRKLSEDESFKSQIEPWPRVDIGIGLYNLLMSLQGRTPEQLGMAGIVGRGQLEQVFAMFKSRVEAYPQKGPRSIWEETLEELFPRSSKATHELMKLANEAYHYNFAACLFGNNPSRAVGVVTRYSGIFAEFRDTKEARFTEINCNSELWLPCIPRYHLLQNGTVLRQVVTPGTTVNDAKLMWHQCFEKAVGETSQHNAENATWAAEQYGHILAELFDPGRRREKETAKKASGAEKTIEIGFSVVAAYTSYGLMTLLQSKTGLSIDELSKRNISALVGLSALLGSLVVGEWWNKRRAKSVIRQGLTYRMKADIKEGKAASALALDPNKASQHVSSLPVWKD